MRCMPQTCPVLQATEFLQLVERPGASDDLLLAAASQGAKAIEAHRPPSTLSQLVEDHLALKNSLK